MRLFDVWMRSSVAAMLVAGVVAVALSAPCASADDASTDGPSTVTNAVGMAFVSIPEGEFVMGSPAEDRQADDDERPQHLVRISHRFYLARFETTQAEFRAVMGSNPSWFSATGGGRGDVVNVDTDKLPVDMTTWEEAVDFCKRLSELPAERAARRTYRLPTEAEWEYAARAGSKTRWAFGDSLSPSRACILDPFADVPARPRAVGSFLPNAFGLCDMHGNVWEWCADRYDADAYRRFGEPAVAKVDPQGPDAGTGHVVRGGDYRSSPTMARSAHRDFTRSTRRDQGNGFRVVLVPADGM